MDTIEMLNRLKSMDLKAYSQFTETYGWRLYYHIHDRVKDREKAEDIYNKTMSDFCKCLTDYEGEDAIESLLNACAENVCCRMDQIPGKASQDVRPIQKVSGGAEEKSKSGKRKGRFGFALCVVLLLFGITAVDGHELYSGVGSWISLVQCEYCTMVLMRRCYEKKSNIDPVDGIFPAVCCCSWCIVSDAAICGRYAEACGGGSADRAD